MSEKILCRHRCRGSKKARCSIAYEDFGNGYKWYLKYYYFSKDNNIYKNKIISIQFCPFCGERLPHLTDAALRALKECK